MRQGYRHSVPKLKSMIRSCFGRKVVGMKAAHVFLGSLMLCQVIIRIAHLIQCLSAGFVEDRGLESGKCFSPLLLRNRR